MSHAPEKVELTGRASGGGLCLVTGGGGFLGTHLAARLSRAGYGVRVLDLKSPSGGGEPGTEEIEFIRGSTGDLRALRRSVKSVKYLFHFAGVSNPIGGNWSAAFDVVHHLADNTTVLLEAAEAGVEKIVFPSSGGAVYGEPSVWPVPENAGTDPVSSYGIVKLSTEKYLALLERQAGVTYAALRFGNVYGAGQLPKRSFGVISAFLGAALRGEPAEVWGDGSAVKDFVYVNDAVDAALLASAYRGPARVFNIGSGRATSIVDLVAVIGRVTGKPLLVSFGPKRPGDVSGICLDVSRAEGELKWRPTTDLETGIRLTWHWMRDLEERARVEQEDACRL